MANQNKENSFTYYSNLLIKFPDSKVKWVEFDKQKYIADLFLIFDDDDLELSVSKICNLKNLKFISNFEKN